MQLRINPGVIVVFMIPMMVQNEHPVGFSDSPSGDCTVIPNENFHVRPFYETVNKTPHVYFVISSNEPIADDMVYVRNIRTGISLDIGLNRKAGNNVSHPGYDTLTMSVNSPLEMGDVIELGLKSDLSAQYCYHVPGCVDDPCDCDFMNIRDLNVDQLNSTTYNVSWDYDFFNDFKGELTIDSINISMDCLSRMENYNIDASARYFFLTNPENCAAIYLEIGVRKRFQCLAISNINVENDGRRVDLEECCLKDMTVDVEPTKLTTRNISWEYGFRGEFQNKIAINEINIWMMCSSDLILFNVNPDVDYFIFTDPINCIPSNFELDIQGKQKCQLFRKSYLNSTAGEHIDDTSDCDFMSIKYVNVEHVNSTTHNISWEYAFSNDSMAIDTDQINISINCSSRMENYNVEASASYFIFTKPENCAPIYFSLDVYATKTFQCRVESKINWETDGKLVDLKHCSLKNMAVNVEPVKLIARNISWDYGFRGEFQKQTEINKINILMNCST